MPATKEKRPLEGCRIAIVEDEHMLADTISDVLEGAGASIVGPFPTMVEALENLTLLDAIDGAVLDIRLGKSKSYPFADALQATAIPFMFLTVVDKCDLPKQFEQVPHMLKPFDDDALVRTLVEIGVRASGKRTALRLFPNSL